MPRKFEKEIQIKTKGRLQHLKTKRFKFQGLITKKKKHNLKSEYEIVRFFDAFK